jgi:hypothetical protein
MKRQVFESDNEPIDPKRNPALTLEEAIADPFCRYELAVIEELGRNYITRLQLIEYIMSRSEISRWTEEREYDNGLPEQLTCKSEEFYLPTYLKAKVRPRYVEDSESD